MEIVTNPGSNLLPEIIAHYGLHVAPQRIVANGKEYDTRNPISFDQIDEWIKTSPEFPYVIGTSAQEFLLLFQSLARVDPEILVVTTSRKVIQTHAAAMAATRSLAGHSAYRHLRVSVVDSGMTDMAAGLLTMMAGEAKRAGLSMKETVTMLERVAGRSKYYVVPETFENLVKGGRASWLRALFADMLRVRPVISFIDGELKSVGTVSAKGDRGAELTKLLVRDLGKRRVWVGLGYSGTLFSEAALAGELRRTMNVEYVYSRPIASSIYVHIGAGALSCAVLPVDDLPWTPTIPPRF